MKIAITSIQRNRNPYIVEWVAFHLLIGFNQFYIYFHKTTDGMTEILMRLSDRYPIKVIPIYNEDYPQLIAYQHAWTNFGKSVEWMAFIDGDEFLFPTKASSISAALAGYARYPISAIGVYWKCYGSNGHDAEPQGLILENFPMHSRSEFIPNRHVKSIVRGGENLVLNQSHFFQTERGTVDEYLQPITSAFMADRVPTYDVFRINHYVVQSRSYFYRVKQGGGAADLPKGSGWRSDEWFRNHDRNEENDGMAEKFVPDLLKKMAELNNFLENSPSQSTVVEPAVPRQIVKDYRIVAEIPSGIQEFAGNSVGLKEIVAHVFQEKSISRSVLDIGFGVGDLGRIVKENPDIRHWHVDGIDGYAKTCCNSILFKKEVYRNIWHGLAQDLPLDALHSYDLLCLFDVIEHLDSVDAKKLISDLLDSLGPEGRLVISTPLWFWPQGHQNPDDLEEHKIAVPAQSLATLSPLMFHIHPKYLVGTFVFSRRSLALMDNFLPTSDKKFDFEAGLRNLQALGLSADGVLYFVQ